MHNKFIISLVAAVFLGALVGHSLFAKYQQETKEVIKETNSLYFIQEGSYDTQEQAENATKELDTKIIVKEDKKYYVYLAITQREDNLNKLKKMFQDEKIEITVKEMNITDESFLNSLEQMDGLLEKTKDKKEMDPINKVVLANYQEIILKQ